MRKIITLLLVLCMLVTITACSTEKNENTLSTTTPDTSTSTTVPENSTTEETNSKEKQWETESKWIATNASVAINNDEMIWYSVPFADYCGRGEPGGKVAEQNDGSIMFVGQQSYEYPSIDKTENIFPTYICYMESALEMYIGGYAMEYFDATIETNEIVTINEHEMCKITGTITFNWLERLVDEKPVAEPIKFIAYGTLLKENGAVVFWGVTDKNGLGESIEEDKLEYLANRMAESFHEGIKK